MEIALHQLVDGFELVNGLIPLSKFKINSPIRRLLELLQSKWKIKSYLNHFSEQLNSAGLIKRIMKGEF